MDKIFHIRALNSPNRGFREVELDLPDYALAADYGIGEIDLVRYELGVDSLDDCVLLETQCILPEAGDLMTQYSDIGELVRDGDNLGHIMDERGQGEPHWMEKFAAALEYEDCRTLKFALDISQNMRCYEWVPKRVQLLDVSLILRISVLDVWV